ncbi:hypothetical protein [Collinsella vaginalis]|uniref:hypothetical protein n=1 Tax=Collinsella vaginalis TaxID=1870987 RepID=UPI001FEAAB6D|nr:hypothetical protein [Collinsella vaginalis]
MGVAEERAQATVEMAVMAPVLIIVALIVYNLMVFISATARFDRVAPDIVLAHGASPVGGEGAATAAVAATVKTELERAMGTYDIEVEVSVAEEEDGSPTALLSLVGGLRTFTCTMRFTPWPQGLALAGIALGAPVRLTHERAVIVDPWRPGVII